MTASPPEADVAQHRPQVRFVPFADIACRRLLVVDRRINLAVDFANIARFDEPAFVQIVAYATYQECLCGICFAHCVPAMAGNTMRKTDPCGTASEADNLPP